MAGAHLQTEQSMYNQVVDGDPPDIRLSEHTTVNIC